MNEQQIMQIFADTAYIRVGGSEEELRCARYLMDKLKEMGLEAELAPFPVPEAQIHQAVLELDGVQIPCEGYLCAGDAELEAPFYYMPGTDPLSLSGCRGKIVMIDGRMGYWRYQDVLDNGALGFITYDGDLLYSDYDIDRRELRSHVHQGRRIPGVHINVRDAVEAVKRGVTRAKITLRQTEATGRSHNVILDLPGQVPQYIAFTAHYDSTALSQGAYDNMSGSIGLLAVAEHYASRPHRYGLRLIWCGSEERGLLGSKAYCQSQEALAECVLNINLDMIGCIMGKFIACCTAQEELVGYLKYLAREVDFPVHAYQEVYSSDSTPFADRGIPAVSFARWAPENTAMIHCSHDTRDLVLGRQMVADIGFILAFTDRMANAAHIPVERTIPENMKKKLDEYLCRVRPKDK